MKKVFLSISADIIHGGHIAIIQKAAELGELTVGVLSDSAVAQYKKLPLLNQDERIQIISGLKGVSNVVLQNSLGPKEILLQLKPDILVHGDNWRQGYLKSTRYAALDTLAVYGGQLVEFPYTENPQYNRLELENRKQFGLPENRVGLLRKLLALKPLIRVIEVHSGITGLLAENTKYEDEGKIFQFDAMWSSSLCDSTLRGKPDIELVDMTSRLRTLTEIAEVTTKPIIYDGDTGGLEEHFAYNVRTLERAGVSAVIIEDKTGLKRNSLFGTEVAQIQESTEVFSRKIEAGKNAQTVKDFMVIARIESLIAGTGIDDALNRAFAYVAAKADGIMIHSKEKSPDEVFEFIEKFRVKDALTPLVVVPTSYNAVTEAEFERRGVNIVIHANHLMRSSFKAMRRAAETILKNGRSLETDELCVPFKEIISLL